MFELNLPCNEHMFHLSYNNLINQINLICGTDTHLQDVSCSSTTDIIRISHLYHDKKNHKQKTQQNV